MTSNKAIAILITALTVIQTNQAGAADTSSGSEVWQPVALETLHQERLENLLVYYACDHRMSVKPLNGASKALCIDAYTSVKIGFIPYVSFEDYVGLPSKDRAMLNRVGYKRFKEWEAAHSDMVEYLKKMTMPSQ